MKKELLFLLIMSVMCAAPVTASVTPEEQTDAEYLINAGYSQTVAEDVFMSKNRAAGKPIEPLYEKSQNKFVKGWNSFWAYLDPSRENTDRLHHDIKLTPSYTDL